MNSNTVESLINSEVTRELAKYDFWEFCQWIDPKFFDIEKRPHLNNMAGVLMSIFTGEINKASISTMRRAGKSYIITLFCAWMLGKYPEKSIMRNSYSDILAWKFSYDVREIIKSEKYRMVFPDIEMSENKKSVTGWNLKTAKQVSYFCAGVGGPTTGFGCDLLAILDDPIKNFEEAMSELVLEKKWNWYVSTHRSSMEKGCAEIHIATRWSKKDIIGRLKEENYFDRSIEIPALINNRSYCEANITTEELLNTKSITDDNIWNSLYMQEPVEIKGTLFPTTELNYFKLSEINQKPDGIVAVCDIADEGTDYLSFPVAYIYGQKVYVVDVVFTQQPVEVTEGLVSGMIIQHKVQRARFESNAGGKIYAQNVAGDIQDKKVSCDIEWQQTTKNKETRILIKSGIVKKNFYFRNDINRGSHYDKFMNQLTSYIAGGKNAHDDAPDSVTMLSELLEPINTQWL